MFNQGKTASPGERRRLREILSRLEERYPGAKTKLNYNNNFQLLVAVILSAQTTDEQVNRVTGPLFERFESPEQIARLDPSQLEPYLKGCGLYRRKSVYLVEASRRIIKEHGGEVPGDFEALTALPGVGRKSANVVLSTAFGLPALAVDTHVFRVARRLGLARGETPDKVEEELKAIIPPGEWLAFHHRLIALGREICSARQPRCRDCILAGCCPHGRQSRGLRKIQKLKKERDVCPGKS